MFSIAPNPFCDIFDLGAVFTVTALALAFGHYFPWIDLLGKELSRPGAYIYGTLSVFVPPAALSLCKSVENETLIFAASIVVGGIADLACYAFDSWRTSRREKRRAEAAARDAAQREAELRKSLEGPVG